MNISSTAIGLRAAVVNKSFPRIKLGKIKPGDRLHIVPGRLGIKYAPYDVEFVRWTKAGDLWCLDAEGHASAISSRAVESILPNGGVTPSNKDDEPT